MEQWDNQENELGADDCDEYWLEPEWLNDTVVAILIYIIPVSLILLVLVNLWRIRG